jgi:hypothetical protein
VFRSTMTCSAGGAGNPSTEPCGAARHPTQYRRRGYARWFAGQVQPADDDVASGRSEQEGVQRSLPGHEATGRSSGSRGFRARPPPGTPPLLAHATTASLTTVIWLASARRGALRHGPGSARTLTLQIQTGQENPHRLLYQLVQAAEPGSYRYDLVGIAGRMQRGRGRVGLHASADRSRPCTSHYSERTVFSAQPIRQTPGHAGRLRQSSRMIGRPSGFIMPPSASAYSPPPRPR